jgi:uncharacterized protein
MGALRSLLFLAIIFFAVWLIRRHLSAADNSSRAKPRQPAKAEMRQCAYCGVHAPITTGILAKDVFYCCEDHWRMGQRR